jgi:hypothetical protein
MEIVRLHTVSVHIHPDSYLVIPLRIDAGDASGDRAPLTWRRASLTPAQGDVLYREAAAFREVAEQVRALARGGFAVTDLGGDAEELPSHPDEIVSVADHREVRCTGGRVYWW